MDKFGQSRSASVIAGLGTLLLTCLVAMADEPRRSRSAAPAVLAGVPATSGRVMTYERRKSIAVGIPRLRTAPAEFVIDEQRTKIELLGDAKEIAVGMPVTVWPDPETPKLAARIVAGTADRNGRAMGAMAGEMTRPRIPRREPSWKTLPGKRSEPEASARLDRLLAEEVLRRLPSDIQLAPRTSDEAFLRRATLDLIGHLPTRNEIESFCADSHPDKRTRTVERLLADPRFGMNWGRYWRDVIAFRQVSENQNLSRPLEWFLTDQFNRNVGWEKIVAAFITATGNIYQQGETAIFMAQGLEPVDVASETARVFLGIQIQCAQCHDHPTDRWRREQFHEFAAFFPRVRIQRVRGEQGNSLLASVDSGPVARRPGSGPTGALEYFMPELKNSQVQGKLITPVFFLTGQHLEPGATDAERRQSLARWLTAKDNPWFASALVNRLWAELVGEGFFEPVDDLGPDRTSSAPRTLGHLSDQFAAHDYDLKWLMQLIMATDAYQRESRPPRHPAQPAFTANTARRLRADQLMNVLADALETEVFVDPQAASRVSRARGLIQADAFRLHFGYDPSVRREEIPNSIPQVLVLMNAPAINQAISGSSPGTVLARSLTGASSANNSQVITELFLRCLSRHPNRDEMAVCLDEVQAGGDRVKALEAIYWSLVNCEEFRFRQ